ncbi:MAG: signal peptide peptidase SppA [Phycisphaerales bacterium]|nr:signal peptide peptidase SppA [Phycisphaerales bacterium]
MRPFAKLTRGLSLLAACLLIAAGSPPAEAGKKVLRMKLDGAIAEAPSKDADLMSILGGGGKQRSLYEWVEELDKVAADPEFAGVVMIIDEPSIGIVHVEELTRSLAAVRAKGKKVLAFMDSAGNSVYPLATAADHISLSENSDLSIVGLHAEAEYYKGLLDKVGLEMDMLHCGAYKSALEPFVRTEPSKEARENIDWLLTGIYDRWIQLMADGRKLSVEQIKAAVDQAPIVAAEALKLKLIDAVESFDDFSQRIRKEFGQDCEVVKKYKSGDDDFEFDMNNPFALFQKINEMMEEAASSKEATGIAIIYLEGGITTGKSTVDFFGGGRSVGSTTFRAAFDEATENDAIKAVVLRVNSPGGSALASDIIWKAATRCAKKKPLIVSMGGVAGSGGYYVAIPGDTIFAEESTITASIGVVGGKMIWKGLWQDKLGINTVEFNRGKNAGLMSTMSKWTDAERAFMMKYMDSIYEQFKGRIKTSRGERIKGDLESMAGGRVFTGKQALERGLVDKIGGLQDAVRLAAKKAGLDTKDLKIHNLPREKDFADVLREIFGEESKDEYEIRTEIRASLDSVLGGLAPTLRTVAPERFRALSRAFEQLMVLDREHVSCYMPLELRIR